MAEIAVRGARGEDQVIVGEGYCLSICIVSYYLLSLFVHSGYFSHDYCHILMIAKNASYGCCNLARRQHCRCHLVKQRLKQVVVGAVDQDHLGGCFPESLGGGKATKTSSDDNDPWLSHLFLDSFQSAALDSRRVTGIVPLARKPLISSVVKPSSFRTSSLCSPIRGARLAGTLETPCT